MRPAQPCVRLHTRHANARAVRTCRRRVLVAPFAMASHPQPQHFSQPACRLAAAPSHAGIAAAPPKRLFLQSFLPSTYL
jgi:hypothetical protein